MFPPLNVEGGKLAMTGNVIEVAQAWGASLDLKAHS